MQISYNFILPCFYQYCTSHTVYCTEVGLILQTAAVSGCSPTNSCHASCWPVACSSTPGAFEYCPGFGWMSPRPFCRCACQNGTEFPGITCRARHVEFRVEYYPDKVEYYPRSNRGTRTLLLVIRTVQRQAPSHVLPVVRLDLVRMPTRLLTSSETF